MLDRKYITEHLTQVQENCRLRGVNIDLSSFADLESQRLEKLRLSQDLNRQANETSKGIGKAKSPEERDQMVTRGRELRAEKDQAQTDHDRIDAELDTIQRQIPNLTHPDAPVGGEEDAIEIALGRTPIPKFDFKPVDHLELARRTR